MKKLFLRDGKHWVGEFPEPPGRYFAHYSAGGRTAETAQEAGRIYNLAVESAKESAVEVDPSNGFWKALLNSEGIATGEGSEEEVTFAINHLQEGQLYDLPSGWTVKHLCDHFKTMDPKFCSRCMGKCPDWRARLIPSENAQGEKAATKAYNSAVDLVDTIHKASAGIVATGIHQNDDSLPADGKLKEVFEKSSLFATGIPEAGQPEALAFLNEDDWTVPESGEKPEQFPRSPEVNKWLTEVTDEEYGRCDLIQRAIPELRALGTKGKYIAALVLREAAVPPPSQAESELTELEAAQAEYIAVLLMEIDSLVGIAHVHGWKSQLVELGKRCRDRVVELQKHKKP